MYPVVVVVVAIAAASTTLTRLYHFNPECKVQTMPRKHASSLGSQFAKSDFSFSLQKTWFWCVFFPKIYDFHFCCRFLFCCL